MAGGGRIVGGAGGGEGEGVASIALLILVKSSADIFSRKALQIKNFNDKRQIFRRGRQVLGFSFGEALGHESLIYYKNPLE